MFVRGIVGAVIGALAGALVWGALTYFLKIEVGYVAWGIGGLVGFLALAFSGGEGSPGLGVCCAGIALLGIVAGKLFGFWLALGNLGTPTANPEQVALCMVADAVVDEYQTAGKPVNFPPGKSVETAEKKQDYPPEIWAEAETRWQAKSAEERKAVFDALAKGMQFSALQRLEMSILALRNGAGLSPFDLLWVFLAVSTAFKLASGGEDS